MREPKEPARDRGEPRQTGKTERKPEEPENQVIARKGEARKPQPQKQEKAREKEGKRERTR